MARVKETTTSTGHGAFDGAIRRLLTTAFQGSRAATPRFLVSPALWPPGVAGLADTTRLAGSVAGERNRVTSGATEGGRHSVHFNRSIHNFTIRRVSGVESAVGEVVYSLSVSLSLFLSLPLDRSCSWIL